MTASERARPTGLPRCDETAGIQAGRPQPPALTTPRRAIWSGACLLAIVGVMFAAFYGINAQRTQAIGTSAAAITTFAPDQTTGQR